MFLRVIKEAFGKWWDKLGYAFLNSILGIVNPFFVAITFFCIWALWLPDWQSFSPYLRQAVILLPPLMLASPFFPTTFGVWVIEKRIVEYETIYFKQYFKDYFKAVWKWMKRSLAMMFLFLFVGFLLSFSLVFYYDLLQSPGIRLAVVIVVAWLLLFIRMIEFVLIPLWIYNDELKFTEAFKIALKIIALDGLTVLGVMIVNGILLALLTLTRALSGVLYYGISANLRLFLHKNIVAKHAPKTDEVEDERLKNLASYQKTVDAWAVMLGKIDRLKKNKDKPEDE